MKKSTIALMIILLLFGCKTEKAGKVEQGAVKSIIVALNDGDGQEAYEISAEAIKSNPTDGKLYFYQASALAMQAGIDVYSLFGLIELKLFRIRAIDWSEMKHFDNPYAKYLSNTVLTNANEKIKEEIGEINNLIGDYSDQLSRIKSSLSELAGNPKLVLAIESTSDFFISFAGDSAELSSNEKYNELKKIILEQAQSVSQQISAKIPEFDYNKYLELRLDLIKAKRDLEQLSQQVMEESPINVFSQKYIWMIYEIVAMGNQIPLLAEEKMEIARQALEVMKEGKKWAEQSNLQAIDEYIAVLSSVLLYNSLMRDYYQHPAEIMSSPIGFLCNLNIVSLFADFDNSKYYLLALLSSLENLSKEESGKNKYSSMQSSIDLLNREDVIELFGQQQKQICSKIEVFKAFSSL